MNAVAGTIGRFSPADQQIVAVSGAAEMNFNGLDVKNKRRAASLVRKLKEIQRTVKRSRNSDTLW